MNRSESPQQLLSVQRSHVLFVLSNAEAGRDRELIEWHRGAYRETVSALPGVLSVEHYEQHPVDITGGRHPRLPFQYLGIHELSMDGAQAAEGVIEQITALHRDEAAAAEPATWLYYPVSEKVGRSPATRPAMLTLAFANGVAGQEAEFREWYATRHIRHALVIPQLVSGQCFERTQFQRPGALEAGFNTIAVYEQQGTPEEMLTSFAATPASALQFPTLDLIRFAESVYRRV